ncbi:SDR family NAD(P)-dependent oxidoreductase [Candidatus Auribacterota bacterium]
MATAIITGGALRLGRQMALYLAQKGFNIALHYHRSSKEAEGVIKEIRSCKVRCKGFSLDLTELQSVESFISQVVQHFEDISLLVNSAAIFPTGKIEETETEKLLSVLKLNLIAPFILMREYRKKVNKGQIVNILDQRIAKNLPLHSAYSISKVALAHLTSLGAVEFGNKIRVNGMALGLILPVTEADKAFFEQKKEKIPLKKSGNVEAVLKGLGYLIANDFVTGEILYIDGGESKS